MVTFGSATEPRGITINSFTSVSIEPPLVLVSVARRARSHEALFGRPFCVNVLAAEQAQLAHHFAGKRNVPVAWVEGVLVPRLAGVLAHLECQPWRDYDGGDHTLFLGEVVDYDYRDGDALAFHSSQFMPLVTPELGVEQLL